MSNSVNSTPGNPRIIQINTPGPQGPQGPAGSITGSIDGDFKALNITSSGVISSSLVSTDFSLIAHSASFNYFSASTGDFDNNTIRIGGSSWSKSDIDNLKLGKSIATDQNKSMKNSADSTTYIRNDTSAKINFYIANSPVIQLGVGSATIGNESTPVIIGDAGITGGMLVTGSTEISGSCVVSGSFTVTDLLSVLADYGQTGSFGVSGSSTFQGDVNMDGNVNVNDLLTVLAGFNASGSNTITGSCEISGSLTSGTPTLIITGSTEMTGSCIVDGPFTAMDLITVLQGMTMSGSFDVNGNAQVIGDMNCDGVTTTADLLIVLGGFGNTAGDNVDVSGSVDEVYDNDIYIYQSTEYDGIIGNSGLFSQVKIKSGSAYTNNTNFDVMYTGSDIINFGLPPLSEVGPGFSYHIINKHNILYQGNVTMSISPASTDKFLYLPNGTTGSDNKALLSYTPSGSDSIGQGNPFIKFTYGNSDGWSITELGGTWEQES